MHPEPDMTRPFRSHLVDELVNVMLLEVVTFTEENLKDMAPDQKNMILEMLEVCVSLPPSWFSEAEKTIIVNLIPHLYGPVYSFVDDLNSGHVSFINRRYAILDEGMERPRDIHDIVLHFIEAHQKIGGTVDFPPTTP